MCEVMIARQGIEPNLSPASARNFCLGPMDYFDLNTPAGISSHIMEVAGVIGSRASYDMDVIRTKRELGVSTSTDDVEKILKTDIIPPKSIEELIQVFTQ